MIPSLSIYLIDITDGETSLDTSFEALHSSVLFKKWPSGDSYYFSGVYSTTRAPVEPTEFLSIFVSTLRGTAEPKALRWIVYLRDYVLLPGLLSRSSKITIGLPSVWFLIYSFFFFAEESWG